ncbi:MAG: flavodoxin family protein, partial [Oscillospiraceae bacterium]|nr:flavodoxin family protein [Oscillospiraceae bacterium]
IMADKKKVVAFTAGRRNGTGETIVKIALEAIAKMGIDVELIRLNECDLHPCTACAAGPCHSKGPGACIWKDDGPWLNEKFLDSDGYILAAPVWSLSPCGIVTDFRDRVFGPKMDMAMWERNSGSPEWAKGRVKQRPGALISVGGALTENWTSLGMPTLYTTTFSAQTNVVDNMNMYACGDAGEVLLREDVVTRARYLGENLGHAVLNPQIDWEHRWLGPDTGDACPGCHCSVVIAKPGRNYVECAICGRKGNISLDANGCIQYTWPEDTRDRLTMMGKFDHAREIERHGQMRAKLETPELAEQVKYWRQKEEWTVKAPSRTKKAKAE